MPISEVNAGSLNRVGTLLVPTKTRDAAGQPVHGYAAETTLPPTWRLRVRQLRGRERIAAKAIWAEVDYEVTSRYIDGLTFHHRWKLDDDSELEIIEVVHGERQGSTKCMCKRAT